MEAEYNQRDVQPKVGWTEDGWDAVSGLGSGVIIRSAAREKRAEMSKKMSEQAIKMQKRLEVTMLRGAVTCRRK